MVKRITIIDGHSDHYRSRVAFEILNRALVLFGFFSSAESAEVATPARLRVLLARIKTIFTGTQSANHRDPRAQQLT